MGFSGASVSIQYFYGLSDDLTFFSGYSITLSGFTNSNFNNSNSVGFGFEGSVAGVIGYSPNAQAPEDLGGRFREFGASAGYKFLSFGAQWAQNQKGNVDLYTASIGLGFGMQGYDRKSYSYIFSDVTIGPSMHQRKRSPFEQYLTDLHKKFGNNMVKFLSKINKNYNQY